MGVFSSYHLQNNIHSRKTWQNVQNVMKNEFILQIWCSKSLKLKIRMLDGAWYSKMLEIWCSYSLDAWKKGAWGFIYLNPMLSLWNMLIILRSKKCINWILDVRCLLKLLVQIDSLLCMQISMYVVQFTLMSKSWSRQKRKKWVCLFSNANTLILIYVQC